MQYFVIGADGQKYGPVDLETLNSWAAEGRVNGATQIESAENGARGLASQVPGIILPQAAAPVYTPPASTPPSAQPMQSAYVRPNQYGSQPTEADLKGFNGGAFLLSWVWALNHRYYLGLLALIPCLGLAMQIYLGIKGNEIAWESGRFSTVDDMRACQSIWLKWGLGILVAYIILVIINLSLGGR